MLCDIKFFYGYYPQHEMSDGIAEEEEEETTVPQIQDKRQKWGFPSKAVR